MRTLVLGGTRSGKSAFAEKLVSAAQTAQVTYVATATSHPEDPEWTLRIAAHQGRRPPTWRTVAGVGADLPAVLSTTAGPVLLDDIGNWIAALLAADLSLAPAIADLVAAIQSATSPIVCVSPEVGLAPVALTPLGRAFTDALGTANQAVAQVCDAVVLVVAGQALWLKGGPVASVG